MPSARAGVTRIWKLPLASVRTPLTSVLDDGLTSCRSTKTPASVTPIRLGWVTLVMLSPGVPESSRGDRARLGVTTGPEVSIVRVRPALGALMLPARSTERVRTVKGTPEMNAPVNCTV